MSKNEQIVKKGDLTGLLIAGVTLLSYFMLK